MLIATTSQHEILQLFAGDDYFNLVISGFLLILCSRLLVHPVRFFGCSFVYLFAKIDISFCFVGSDGGIRLIDLRFSLWPENLMRKMKTSSKKCYLKHAHAFVHQLVDKTNDNKLASVFFSYLFYLCTYLYTYVSESSGFDAVFLPIENERQWPPIAIFHLVGNLSVSFIYNGVSFFCKHFDLINCYGTEEKLLAVILSRLFYWLGNFSTFNYKIRLFRTLFLLPTLFRLATVFIGVHRKNK